MSKSDYLKFKRLSPTMEMRDVSDVEAEDPFFSFTDAIKMDWVTVKPSDFDTVGLINKVLEFLNDGYEPGNSKSEEFVRSL